MARARGHLVHRRRLKHAVRLKGHLVHHHKNTTSGGAVAAATKGKGRKLPKRGPGGRFVKTSHS